MRVLAPLLVAAAMAAPASADEHEWTIAAQPAAAMIHVADRDAWGGGGALDVSYGVTDAIAVRATGAFTAHALPTLRDATGAPAMPGGSALVYQAAVGVTYTIDILRVVPYVDFAIGLLGVKFPTDKGDKVDNELGLQIGLGVDYLVSRRVSVGVIVRYNAFLTALTQIPVYLYLGPRIALHFGG